MIVSHSVFQGNFDEFCYWFKWFQVQITFYINNYYSLSLMRLFIFIWNGYKNWLRLKTDTDFPLKSNLDMTRSLKIFRVDCYKWTTLYINSTMSNDSSDCFLFIEKFGWLQKKSDIGMKLKIEIGNKKSEVDMYDQ